jgi:hypothetical protein
MIREDAIFRSQKYILEGCRNVENWKVRGKEELWTEVMSSRLRIGGSEGQKTIKMRIRAMDQRTYHGKKTDPVDDE